MKKVAIILVLALLFAMLVCLSDLWRASRVRTQALSLKQGDTRFQVQKALGRPVKKLTPLSETKTNFVARSLGVRCETWAYGRRFNLGLVFHGDSPIPLRMFAPEDTDVSVVFDLAAKVAEITILKASP